MVFPVAAVIGGAMAVGSSLLGSASQASQARAQNRAAEKQAKAQFDRAKKEYAIGNAERLAQWEWDKARVEQLRFNERQAAADYSTYQAKLIAAATRNLEINSGALYDKFATEERLRGAQVGMEYAYTTDKLNSESGEMLRQYLNSINERALQSSATVARFNGESQELLASFALEEQRDELGWQLSQLTGLARAAEARGAAIVRQGGGATSQRMAVDAAQALGRTYGELVLRSQDRGAKVALMNRTMNEGVARELAAGALQTADVAQKMRYTSARYAADAGMAEQQMRDLTIPSFGLANRQYQRELDSLRLQTQQVFDQATMPYRQQTYFDPLEPIKGLAPELVSPTTVAGPSPAGTIANSVLAGVKGAMASSTRDENGRLVFY